MRSAASTLGFSTLAVLAGLGCGSTSPPAGQPGPGAGGGAGAGTPAQMNDLSILFPLPSSEAELQQFLSPGSAGVGGALLPQATFAAAEVQGVAYQDLRVVSFRLDPCFAHIGPIEDPADCLNQLRVVFQPLTFADGEASAGDAAVHAFYSLTRDQFVAALGEVVAARVASGGDADLGPLAVHPILAREGADGAMATRLASIITRYAGATNCTRFTVMRSAGIFGAPLPAGSAGEQRFWNFSGFDVAGGVVTPLVIPTLPDGATNAHIQTAATVPLWAELSPTTTAPDDLHLLASLTQAQAAPAEAQRAAFDASLRIENPEAHSPNTIDCASCHVAEAARWLVGQMGLGLTAVGNPNSFGVPPSVPVEDAGTTTPVLSADDTLNLHAFSYRGTAPMINQRVVNETVAILAYVKQAGL